MQEFLRMPTRNTEVFLTFAPSLKPMLMFSGIVEECATLVAMVKDQENVHFTFRTKRMCTSRSSALLWMN